MAALRRRRPEAAQILLIAMIAVCTGIEGVLQLGDAGVAGVPRLRGTAYEYGGFWAQLLHDWRPNYALQPWAMFVTYGLFHGGLVHLAFNMVTLWSLGGAVAARAGAAGLAAIYAAGLVGGAATYGVIASALQPMVGASGALFGLAGALVGWGQADRRALRESPWPILQALGLLVAINLAMWWALDGNLAWETHLGGFVAGWLAGRAVDPGTGSETDLDAGPGTGPPEDP
ncbi:MAG: rhomboid family intramembrane serine protease [Pseudomonadota bacterium]